MIALALLVSIPLADQRLAFEAPDAWQTVQPRVNLIEKEFSIAPPEGVDAAPARLTIMTAGGSIDANVARWIGQFRGTEGGADRSAAKVDKSEANGMPVTVVDLSGTYLESAGGPFGPKTPRDGYRLLAAIVETQGLGNYFFKLIGPAETVDGAESAFRDAIASLKKQ